jgi:hypothetical protein
MDAPLFHGVGEGAHDVLLPNHLREALRAVPTVKRGGFGHESSLSTAFRLSALGAGVIRKLRG